MARTALPVQVRTKVFTVFSFTWLHRSVGSQCSQCPPSHQTHNMLPRLLEKWTMIEAFGNLQDGKLYPRIFSFFFWKNISLNTRDHKRHNLFYMIWQIFYWIFAEGLCTCSFYVSFIHIKRPSKPETITILELMLADGCVSLLDLVVETKNKQPSKSRTHEKLSSLCHPAFLRTPRNAFVCVCCFCFS